MIEHIKFFKSSALDSNMNYFRKEMKIIGCRLNHWLVIPAKYTKLQISICSMSDMKPVFDILVSIIHVNKHIFRFGNNNYPKNILVLSFIRWLKNCWRIS